MMEAKVLANFVERSRTYQVHTLLSDVAPVRAKGFDHTTQGAYAAAAGVAKALSLSSEQIANAIAISGTAKQELISVTEAGQTKSARVEVFSPNAPSHTDQNPS